MTKACNNMHTAAKGAVSNYSRLKWHAGCSTQNKNRKLKRLIMRRNCFINAPPPSTPPPFLSVAGIPHSPQHRSQFHSRLALSPWRESQKVFHLSQTEDEAHKHDSPERPARKLRTPCPKYLILEEQKIACAYLFAGTKTFLIPQTLRCHWTLCRRVTGVQKYIVIVIGERQHTSGEQKIIVLICLATGAVQNASLSSVLSAEVVDVYF